MVARSQIAGGSEPTRAAHSGEDVVRQLESGIATRIARRDVGVGDPVGAVTVRGMQATGTGTESRSKVIFLFVARVEVVAHAQVKSQLAADFPIVLEVGAHLDVAPTTEIVGELLRQTALQPRIRSSNQTVRLIPRKRQLVTKEVRRTCDIEFAVFEIAIEVYADLAAVLAPLEGHHVAVGIDILVEVLRIAVVRTETSRSIIEADCRNAGRGNVGIAEVQRIPGAGFVNPVGAEGVDPTQLQVGSVKVRRVLEAVDAAAGVFGAEAVRAVHPVVLAEYAVVAVDPVDACGPFVAVEEIARGLRAKDNEVVVQEGDVARNATCLKGGSDTTGCGAGTGKVCVCKVVPRLHAEQPLELCRHLFKPSRVVIGAHVLSKGTEAGPR